MIVDGIIIMSMCSYIIIYIDTLMSIVHLQLSLISISRILECKLKSFFLIILYTFTFYFYIEVYLHFQIKYSVYLIEFIVCTSEFF